MSVKQSISKWIHAVFNVVSILALIYVASFVSSYGWHQAEINIYLSAAVNIAEGGGQ